MNSLVDLNAILFNQIQKIQNEDATKEVILRMSYTKGNGGKKDVSYGF